MFFIWGWGYKKNKDLGSVNKVACSKCSNISKFRLLNYSEWFTFFFVPIIPYSRKNYVCCPVCEHTVEVSDENFSELKQFAILNSAYEREELKDNEYAELSEKLNMILGVSKEVQSSDELFEMIGKTKEFESNLVKFLKSNELKIIIYSVLIIAILYLVF